MKTYTTGYFELKGTHYEIGQQVGKLLGRKRMILNKRAVFSEAEAEAAMKMYDEYCPGLNEEMRGYADTVDVKVERLLYASMTYLRPRCSQMVLLPQLTANGHTLLARSYEFGPPAEDFHLFRTEVEKKYAHIGGSVAEFGRSEGINEYGLGISMTSCGFPVSNLRKMRAPTFPGLQFWAVVRTILENCRNVAEAVEHSKKVPIAYNINLLLVDKDGHAALIETFDGRFALQSISADTRQQYLHSTNHAHLAEIAVHDPLSMRNSRVRFERIQQFLDDRKKKGANELRSFLLREYPAGLNCRFYKEFFGTIKSVIMDLNEGKFSICWGGLEENGWKDYDLRNRIGNHRDRILLQDAQAPPDFFVLE